MKDGALLLLSGIVIAIIVAAANRAVGEYMPFIVLLVVFVALLLDNRRLQNEINQLKRKSGSGISQNDH